MARRRHRHRYGVRIQQRLHSGFARQGSDRGRVSPLRAAPWLPRWCVLVSLCAGLVIRRRAPIWIAATRGLVRVLRRELAGSVPRREWGKTHDSGKIAKRSRRVLEPRPEKQDTGNHFSRQWRQAAREQYLV